MSKYGDTFNRMIDDFKQTGFSKMLKSLWNKLTGSGLTGAEQAQNQFNAEQAELNRQFQAEQTDIAYEREQQSYQSAVKDMQNAGLNPALMYGGGSGGTTNVPAAPAGSTATAGSSQNGVSFSDLLRLATLPAQLKSLEVQNDLRSAQAEQQRSLTKLNELNIDWFEPMSQAKLDDLYSAIGRRDVQNALDNQGISESQAREAVALTQAVMNSIDNETRGQLNELHIQLANQDIALREAETLHKYEEIDRIKHEIKVLDAQANELLCRSLVDNANTSVLNKTAHQILLQNGILMYDQKIKKFDADHQEAYWKWKKAMNIVDGTTKAINSVSSFYMPQIGTPSGNPAATIYNGHNIPGYQYVPGFD